LQLIFNWPLAAPAPAICKKPQGTISCLLFIAAKVQLAPGYSSAHKLQETTRSHILWHLAQGRICNSWLSLPKALDIAWYVSWFLPQQWFGSDLDSLQFCLGACSQFSISYVSWVLANNNIMSKSVPLLPETKEQRTLDMDCIHLTGSAHFYGLIIWYCLMVMESVSGHCSLSLLFVINVTV
jgi:hypothetical protein